MLGLLLALWPRKSADWGGDGWVFPVGDISSSWVGSGGIGVARITNGFDAAKHRGVDIMYYGAFPSPAGRGMGGGTQSRYFAPRGTPVFAASAGTIWSTGLTPRGWNVVIDHGKVATFYQHLAEQPLLAKGDRVQAGQQIGVMGVDPLDAEHVRHLHFELWQGGPDAAIDPAPKMAAWPHPAWDAGDQADWDISAP